MSTPKCPTCKVFGLHLVEDDVFADHDSYYICFKCEGIFPTNIQDTKAEEAEVESVSWLPSRRELEKVIDVECVTCTPKPDDKKATLADIDKLCATK